MAEIRFIERKIIEGDRWDSLAYKYWGDCNYAPILVIDNRHLSAEDDLPEDAICYVREKIEGEDKLIENDVLPFWKR